MSVRFTQLARSDLDDLALYVAREAGLTVAERLVDEIVSASGNLGAFPLMGRRRPDLDARGSEVRSLVQSKHMILYTLYGGDAVVARILHERRDIRPILVEQSDEPS